MSEINLNGNEWTIKDFQPGQGLMEGAFAHDYNSQGWLPATVPGNVQSDLLHNGLLPDPYFGLNSKEYRWTAEREWWYRRTFHIPEKLKDKVVRLHLEGVDYKATFWLNGKLLGSHEGMFTPVEFDVSPVLNFGCDNILAILLDPPTWEREKLVKSQFSFGEWSGSIAWDFATILVTSGLWDDVKLLASDSVYIDSTRIRTTLDNALENAVVKVQFDIMNTRSYSLDTNIEIDIIRESSCSGKPCIDPESYAARLIPKKQTIEREITLKNPALWWPAGHGEQNLYRAEIKIKDVSGKMLNQASAPFGIRKLEMLPNPTELNNSRNWIFTINGRRIYAKGTNWVPADHLFGRLDHSDYEVLLGLAAKGNINMLRVWGGGLIEKKAFYDICDRYGLMVFQEFPLACPRQNERYFDEGYLELLRTEAHEIIVKLRNHPSVVLWCGGNELHGSQGWKGVEDPCMTTMSEACSELDPDRPYHPTSPCDGEIHGNWVYDPKIGHPAFMEYDSLYAFYNQTKGCFLSEFGCSGIANLETLRKIMPEESLWPINPSDENWKWHRAFARMWRDDGQNWLNHRTIQEHFGALPDLEKYISASQFMQAEGLRYACEELRRKKYACSGSATWQYNEPWPNAACTNMVDWYRSPKMAYYYVARSYEPLHVSARYDRLILVEDQTFRAEIWITNDLYSRFDGCTLSYSIIGINGTVFESGINRVDVPEDGSVLATNLEWSVRLGTGAAVFLGLELKSNTGHILSLNSYVYGIRRHIDDMPLASLLNTSCPVTLAASAEVEGDSIKVRVSNPTSNVAANVSLDLPEAVRGYFSDNFFDLLPGCEKDIEIEILRHVEYDIPALFIKGWNVTDLTVPLRKSQ